MKAKRSYRLSATILTVMSIAVMGASVSHAAIMFQDDFESYASGSNLNGQNGWTNPSSGMIVQIDPGSGLSTQVANGRHPFFNIQWLFHPLSGLLDPDEISTLSFDGYGVSSPPPSTNSGVGFQQGQGTLLPTGSVFWDINIDSGGWSFDARFITGNASDRFTIPGHYDEVGHFTISINGLTNEIFGLADFGAGLIETAHFSISDAQISALNNVVMFQDYQVNVNRLGAEFDNILVSASAAPIPEPATISLLFVGLVAMYGRNTARRLG